MFHIHDGGHIGQSFLATRCGDERNIVPGAQMGVLATEVDDATLRHSSALAQIFIRRDDVGAGFTPTKITSLFDDDHRFERRRRRSGVHLHSSLASVCGHGLFRREPSHAMTLAAGSPGPGMRPAAACAKAATCSLVERFSFGKDIHSLMMTLRTSCSGFIARLLLCYAGNCSAGAVGGCTVISGAIAALLVHRSNLDDGN